MKVSKNFSIFFTFNLFYFLDITGYGLAKTVGEYLQLECAASAVILALENAEKVSENSSNINNKNFIIRARTARRWLEKSGISYKNQNKYE